jgi:hypothetical protein
MFALIQESQLLDSSLQCRDEVLVHFRSELLGKMGNLSSWNGLDYFCTVNGVENAVLSHIIFNTPPPEGFLEMAIVN